MKLLSLFTTLLLIASSNAADDYAAETFAGTNGALPYRFLSPATIQPETKYPLVIFLHGAGERGDDNIRQLHHGGSLFLDADTRRKFPAFVIFPQCPDGKRWVEVDWGDPKPHQQPKGPSAAMSPLIELIPELLKSKPIDTSRVYVMGISMGGFGVWDLAARHPDWFAAAVPICGGADDSTAPLLARMPIWTFHGDQDNTVKTGRTRSMVEALRKAGGNPKYSELPGIAHNSWSPAFANPDLLPWLFAQKRP
ncbi:MAG: PHB depolymerase family esterase [Luteolibacter sp.]|jgi:predicted peptidase|nr:PHB depolymerase family esterase [Luteolibacter sp.]